MNWEHIKLIFEREVRDQLRDRRTMFTIFVLPILLYPLMGIVMFEVAQIPKKNEVRIGIVGSENIPDGISFVDEKDENLVWRELTLDESLEQALADSRQANASKRVVPSEDGKWAPSSEISQGTDPTEELSDIGTGDPSAKRAETTDAGETAAVAPTADLEVAPTIDRQSSRPSRIIKNLDSKNIEAALRKHNVDLLVSVPPEFHEKNWEVPLHVVSNQRWERSMLASSIFQSRVEQAHQKWLKSTLSDKGVGESILDSPRIDLVDAAKPESKRALIWSKILPFVMLIWALTGAFYPAVDLCAGEKERGTLETLLSSPINRREIVWGKLLTIFCFSLGTALLNLASMYATASFVMAKFQGTHGSGMAMAIGPIPLASLGWLILLVIPLSAMFSALALAVASLASSTKEGQYYLMPLLLVGMPLVMLPMLPGMVLAPGTSIIPVTGAILLSRTLMDGEYVHALLHLPTVITVTILCTLLATRWAARQFESESVLFPDSSRSSVSIWFRATWQQRENIPSVSESVLCGLVILVTLFFGRLSLDSSEVTWQSLVQSTLIVQLGLMLGPALIMATTLTRSFFQTFRIHWCSWQELAVCMLLAIALHPSYTIFATLINHEYQLSAETMDLMKSFNGILASAPMISVILVMALLPAICEELVFRGFIFSGLSRNSGQIRAILLSAIVFGLSHGVLQQTMLATSMGILLGWIAYKTNTVLTTIVFHLVHNTLSMVIATCSTRGDSIPRSLSWAIIDHEGAWSYTDMWSTLSVGISIALIGWLITKTRPRSPPNPL